MKEEKQPRRYASPVGRRVAQRETYDGVMEANEVLCGSVEEVQAAVRAAVESGVPVCDYGAAHGGVGHPPPEPHSRLRLGGELTGMIEHYREDFTVRVGAGCTVGDLRETMAATGQWLPLDAEDDITLGECVNHNMYGPLRLRYGSTRDLLLGLSFVSGEGEAIRVGGRTVKNVAGYDVTKLMVGSLGQLGILTEVTLRTYAIPEATVNVEIHLPDPTGVDEMLPGWLTTDAAPVWLSLMGPEPGGATGRHGAAGAAGESIFTLRAGYHGDPAACLHQLRSLETLLDTQPGWHLASAQETDLEGDERARKAGASVAAGRGGGGEGGRAPRGDGICRSSPEQAARGRPTPPPRCAARSRRAIRRRPARRRRSPAAR